MLAVKNFVNHQYNFKARPLTIRNAPLKVPNIVRAAARVVRSSLSHVEKKERRKLKLGVERRRISCIEGLPRPASVRNRPTDGCDMAAGIKSSDGESEEACKRCFSCMAVSGSTGGREVLPGAEMRFVVVDLKSLKGSWFYLSGASSRNPLRSENNLTFACEDVKTRIMLFAEVPSKATNDAKLRLTDPCPQTGTNSRQLVV